MLKTIIVLLAILFLSGCMTDVSKPIPSVTKVQKTTTSQEVTKKHIRYQTVSKKDAILVQKGKDKEHCSICGMNLVKFYKTSHIATDEKGKVHQYCSLHCLADDLRKGAQLKNPKVVDAKSLKFIPVQEAYYVVGSNVKGTMSRVSKYAFKSLDDAKAFQAKHGGKIVDFHSAWERAKKDFK